MFFFLLLSSQGPDQCQHLFKLGAFNKLLVFLLGADRIALRPLSPSASSTSSLPREPVQKAILPNQKSLAIPLPSPSPTSTLQRRWSQAQAKDFHDLHTTMATMILNCNIEGQMVKDCAIAMPSEVHVALYGSSAPFYMQVNTIDF